MANGANPGFGASLAKLMDNKLFLQYLNAAGQDIGAGNPIGANVGKVTEQNIASQNYAKLLRTLLSNGGKVSMDKDNVSIKAPSSAFQGVELDPGTGLPTQLPGDAPNQGAAATGGQTSPTRSSETDLLSNLLSGNLDTQNPSASPLGIGEIPASDLAGLTPQDISQALQFKFSKEEMSQQKINDAINRLYKVSQIQQGQAATQVAQAKELRAWEELLRESPLEVPGLGAISLDTWDKLPTDVKAYSYYAFTATKAGEDVLSFNEFKQQADPASFVQYYNLAKEDPAFKEFYFESKRAGATKITIGEKVETKKALSWVDFTNNLTKDVEKFKESESFQSALIEFDPGSPDEADTKAVMVADHIENQLLNRGRIVGKELSDEGVITWTVVTNTGKVENVRYDLYK